MPEAPYSCGAPKISLRKNSRDPSFRGPMLLIGPRNLLCFQFSDTKVDSSLRSESHDCGTLFRNLFSRWGRSQGLKARIQNGRR
jgi:hypothetical protein